MSDQPCLSTGRLILRPFTLADAPDVQHLAGDAAIAATTLNIPHPYEDGMAEDWIRSHRALFEDDGEVVYAVILRETDELVGAISLLEIDHRHRRAELGYWVGKPFWNQGYATEAALALIAHGFDAMSLNRIQATHLVRNPASGRVMQKAGMSYEGKLRQYVLGRSGFEDLELYAIVRSDIRADPVNSGAGADMRRRAGGETN